MSLGPGMPSPATLLFDQPTRSFVPIINRIPISIANDDEHHKTLVKSQTKMRRNLILPETILLFQ